MATNRYINQRVKAAIYKLKRLYGGTIFVYKKGDPTTDLTTGVKTWTDREVYRVERAIILPVNITREQRQTISMISADKEFVYGGFYDRGARQFFIDPLDLPSSVEIKQDDFIMYDRKQYAIHIQQHTEFDSLIHIWGREIEGVVPQQIHEMTAKHILDFSQTAVSEVD